MSRTDDTSTTMAEQRPTRDASHGVLKRLYHGETRADLVGRWKTWFALSGVVILIGVVALLTRGLNLGIDFTGGTVWELRAGDAEVAEVTEAMAALGYDDVQVQEITQASDDGDARFLRVEAESTADPSEATEQALAGMPWTRKSTDAAREAAGVLAREGSPLSDHRASDRYRIWCSSERSSDESVWADVTDRWVVAMVVCGAGAVLAFGVRSRLEVRPARYGAPIEPASRA